MITYWVIFHHVKDRPGPYTVRRFSLTGAYPDAEDFLTLEAARAAIPDVKMCIGRHPDDDPVIVEVWW